MDRLVWPAVIQPLPVAEGGGLVALVPDRAA